MTGLKVLGRVTSINVRKVLWLLGELGVAYEREDWGLPIRDPNVPEFLRLNPNAQVPVIVGGDFVLWESTAIMRYLAETHDSPLLPREPHRRALVDQWLGWQATDLNSQWGYAFMGLARKTPGYADEARTASSILGWNQKMTILEGQLEKTRAFAAGADFSLADIALGLSVHRWYATPFEHPPLPQVGRYYEALKQRPAATQYLTAKTP